jgi:TRAP transporter TAXI family solute receptor
MKAIVSIKLRTLASLALVLLLVAWSLSVQAVPMREGKVDLKAAVDEKLSTVAQSGDAAPKTGGQTFLSIGGGPTGGVFHIVAASMASVMAKNVPGLKITAESTGASTENARLLGRNEIALGLVSSDVAYYAYLGEREFAKDGQKFDNFRLVMTGYSSPLQIFVLATSKIRTVEDIKGKRLIALAGTTVQAHFPTALKAFGITNKDYKEMSASPDAIVEALREGRADVGVISGGAPMLAITDLTTRHDVRFIPIPPNKADQIFKENQWYVPGVIKAGVYRGLDKDVPTVEVPINLVGRKDLATDLVYNITKALSEHTEDLKSIHPMAATFTAVMSTKRTPIVPFHPGAEKYYREKGFLK